MPDSQDLKNFFAMPSVFNQNALREIKNAVKDYDDFKAFVIDMIERIGGEYGFKNPAVYDDVEAEIKWCKYPASAEKKLLAIVDELRRNYAH